jgi:hypothetical protein
LCPAARSTPLPCHCLSNADPSCAAGTVRILLLLDEPTDNLDLIAAEAVATFDGHFRESPEPPWVGAHRIQLAQRGEIAPVNPAESASNLDVADQLRLLLVGTELPLDIPAELAELSKAGFSGPDAVTRARNDAAHPIDGSRLTKAQSTEVRALAIWYFEMSLLRMVRHDVEYWDQLRSAQPMSWNRPVAGSWVDGGNAQPAAGRSLFGGGADRGVVLGGQVLDAIGVCRGPGGRSAVVVA